MNILVTGGTVFVSRYTAEFFSRKGHEVFVLNRGNNSQPCGCTHIKADRHILGGILKKYHFDVVIDVTAYNSTDVLDLLNELGEYGMYILISSSAVYPETLTLPFSEKQQTGVNTIWGKYGTDKIAAEEALISNAAEHYIVRPPYLYGPMNNVYREAFVFDCAEKDRVFYLPQSGEMPLQFLYVDDLCRFIERLITVRPQNRIFNVGNTESITVKEWVKLCYEAAGKIPVFKSVGKEIPQRDYFPFYDYAYCLDISRQSKLISDLTDMKKGLTICYEWYKHNKAMVKRKPLLEYIDNELIKGVM